MAALSWLHISHINLFWHVLVFWCAFQWQATDCFLHVMLSGFFQGHWSVLTLCQILFSMAKFIVTVIAPYDPTLDILYLQWANIDQPGWPIGNFCCKISSETQKYSVRTSSSWLMITLSSGHFFLYVCFCDILCSLDFPGCRNREQPRLDQGKTNELGLEAHHWFSGLNESWVLPAVSTQTVNRALWGGTALVKICLIFKLDWEAQLS